MKNAYLIVPDLHYTVTKEHRYNYLSEVLSVLTQIEQIREGYSSDGFRVKLVFLGDVIDGPIVQSEDAMRCQNLFRYYCSLFDDTFCVLGNHEVNNVSSNPFWFLVFELEDKALHGLNKAIQPQGVEPVIRVPAVIEDGSVAFYFNHYGLNVKVPRTTGTAIGLFHQNVGSSSICKMWGTFTDVEEAAFMRAYNWSFFGHMHLAVGRYYLNHEHTCVGEWLGTCVGTNVTEVETLPRECNIPAVLVEDGNFIGVKNNYILRSNPSEVIDYAKLNATKATNEIVSNTKNIAVKNITAGTLYQRVYDAASDIKLGVLVDLLSESQEIIKNEYKKNLSDITIEE